MAAYKKIRDAEQRLRNVVNKPEIQGRLIQDQRRWQQLCSSMDVIGDTNSAIVAYLDSPPIRDMGHLYLLAYGLLQVLYVQQDAVKHLAKAVGLEYVSPEEFLTVREIRNKAIGHPAERAKGIVQVTLSHEGFTLYSFDWSRPDTSQPILFAELIEAQSAAVARLIEKIIHHLEQMR